MSLGGLSVQPGQLIGGRYRVERLVGEGGYGAIYAATQLMSGPAATGRRVALKLLHPEVMVRATALARFEREAQLAQSLSHPNTLRLFDFGRTESGLPFIVYEFLDGKPLDRVIAEQGRISTLRTGRIAAQIVKALMEAHAAGIVHRDIKPANVFLCDYAGEPDFVKVVDFGIASASGAAQSGAHQTLTQEGGSVGTPAYMPPEQALGEPIDGRADLYALGLLMAEAIHGRPAYEETSGMQVIMQQIADKPVPLPESVKASPLGDIIVRATQKKRERRFGSAAEMLAALDRMLATMSAGFAGPAAPLQAIVRTDLNAPVVPTAATYSMPRLSDGGANALALAPTAGIPVVHGPMAEALPAVPPAPRPGTFSASYVAVPTAPPRRASNAPWVAIGLVAALGIFVLAGAALALGYFYFQNDGGATGGKQASSKQATSKHRSTKEGEDDGSLDLDEPSGPAVVHESLKDFSVQGIGVQTMLDRMGKEGWHYLSRQKLDLGFAYSVGYVFDKGDETAILTFRVVTDASMKGEMPSMGATETDGDDSVDVSMMSDDRAARPLLAKLLRH